MTLDNLFAASYTPYSKQPKAALVKSADGQWFHGVRIENISYPLSISATQNALFFCLSKGSNPAELYTNEINESMISSWEREFNISAQSLDSVNFSNLSLESLILDTSIEPKNKLIELLDNAVVEESDFPVSALLETDQGFISGVNIECTSWNMGLCAERVAIAKAFTAGCKTLKSLHIHTRSGEFSSPCGACRQVIIEHMPNRKIHLHHADHSESVQFSTDLLPHSFQSSSLSQN